MVAVEEYSSSEAFDDNNIQYFYSDFEAFPKQATELFKDIDCTIFKPYDDDNSIMEEAANGKADGQLADDATF